MLLFEPDRLEVTREERGFDESLRTGAWPHPLRPFCSPLLLHLYVL